MNEELTNVTDTDVNLFSFSLEAIQHLHTIMTCEQIFVVTACMIITQY